MENVGREPRIPRSWMETDEDFAMECGRPHRPTPPRRPHCAGWSDDFRTRFDEADFMEDEMFVEEAVNLSAGCGCRPKPPVCPPDCGCGDHDHGNRPGDGCGCGCGNDTDDQDDDGRPGCGNHHRCPDMSLAMAYVARQRWTGKREIYSRPRALLRGTLFVELDLPFTGKGGCQDE